MSEILRFSKENKVVISVVISKYCECNDLNNFPWDKIFKDVYKIHVNINSVDYKTTTSFYNLYNYLSERSIHISRLEICPKCNVKIFDLMSHLNKFDYRGRLTISLPWNIKDYEESLQVIPRNLKALSLCCLPKCIPEIHNTFLSILDFYTTADVEQFLEQNSEKITHLKLTCFYIDSPQRFCDLVARSKIKYLILQDSGDKLDMNPFIEIVFLSYEFRQMLAELIKNSTSLVDIKIEEC